METVDPLGETVLTESSTVRMRRDVLNSLVEKTQPIPKPAISYEPKRSQLDNRTREVWHSRLGAWLRNHLSVAQKPLLDRAVDRKGKAAFERAVRSGNEALRRTREDGERALALVAADARESYATATLHRDTSHAFILQRLTSDAQRLGRVVNKKLRQGGLNHTEATLVDEEYFMTDDWLSYLEFEVGG